MRNRLLHVHLAVLSGPRIYSPHPTLMDTADIGSGESVVTVIAICQLFERADLFAPFHPVHFPLARDSKQVLEHTATGARLVLAFLIIGSIIAVFTLQGSSSLS